jgi:TolB-like protein/Flp pilus assembly protein TadD
MQLMAGGPLQRFWTEIRRRHVPRVAAYYVAGAWVLAQAGSLLLDAFDAAHYTRYVIAALGAGLPVALVLAWVFDVTPRGIERTLALSDQPPAVPPPIPSPPAPERSIAVLPFANLSGDPVNEYFSDGLSEEVRNQLSRVSGLRVAARTSSFAFKGRHEDVREIGRRLNVATLLEGGVRKQEDMVRIDVELVSAVDGFHLWSRTFERRLEDIFRLQGEVAQAVIAAVTARQGEETQALPAPQTQSVVAYNSYLLGRHHFHKRTAGALQRAAQCFEQAIAVDPQYALAYSGLADTHMLLCARYYGNVSVTQAIAQALPAAQRALDLVPTLAEAHASLGMIRLNQGDLAAAEAAFRSALELNPGYLLAHLWLGLALTGQGRYAEAAERNREALRLDPLAPIVNTNVGFDALRFGNKAEGNARFATAIEIDPGFAVPYSGMAHLHSLDGDFTEALRWIERAIERAPARAFFHARKGLLHLQSGDLAAASALIDKAQRMSPDNHFDSELIIALHMARGERDALERIASGEGGRAYTAHQRGQACIRLGDFDAARALYEQDAPSLRREIDEVLNDDWIWRLPHSINRAHLRLAAGDARGRHDLEQFLAEADRVWSQGLVNAEVRYWAATAHAVLGHRDRALEELGEAIRVGWRHAWWARLDWNLRDLADDPRLGGLLARGQ